MKIQEGFFLKEIPRLYKHALSPQVFTAYRLENPMTDHVLDEIIIIAKKYNVQKVVLFGSRARGDHSEASDYDVAIYGDKLSETEKAYLNMDIEEIQTLKKIDVVFVSDNASNELMTNIIKEGVKIYEQT